MEPHFQNNDSSAKAEISFSKRELRKRDFVWSGFKFLFGRRERSFTANRVEAAEYAQERFNRLLRQPYPDASDRELASLWAPRISVSERTVQNWLSGATTPSLTDLVIVGSTHGIFQTAAIFVGEDTRAEVMTRIGQR
ncbi:hypothetical protein HKX54_02260 [Sulfitobacter sp. M57]|uniref:hypothetical protein n=1 Tax=unclassified Sulfitobacter TaxID=196795 RepID=UPI0023E20C1E|nr:MULTISPECIES: hypothetical protein [unclassified Sulfitobacter]MDF3413265.1 hypothetical protein [Sulfitobacter sp. KE5]MDF3421454.1 hypothetical protein [Sulfitobacter sp. KE43]MDF3431812.1 hypothetical protein [Sulfitobacter sp. KE42]MDF3457452.1 hypothetical protein [Sulfitobacter sp. S74]MDF3461355.1 hypothetical protein [Sulfitobacter sp. Ks18]